MSYPTIDWSTWFYNSPSTIGSDTLLPGMAVFGAGLLAGAGMALMLAPKSGRALREDMARTANRIGETVKDRVPDVSFAK